MPDEPLPQLGAQVELNPEDLDDPQAIADKVSLGQLAADDPIVWTLLGENPR